MSTSPIGRPLGQRTPVLEDNASAKYNLSCPDGRSRGKIDSVVYYVPLVLLLVALLIFVGTHFQNQRRRGPAAPANVPAPPPELDKVLIHSINDDRCTGCDACVVVCPTNVLELVDNKSRVIRFGDCIQCVQCMLACPTTALVMHWEQTEPPPVRVPNLDPYYQTEVPGMYLIGEVAGKPLVKNAANAGRAVVEHMLQNGLSKASTAGVVDIAIVGSGPGGLSAALTCLNRKLSYVVLEKEQLLASTVARYPKGKDVMAEPYDVRNVSLLPVFDARKEELLPLWQELVDQTRVEIKRGEAVETVERGADGLFTITTTVGRYRAQRVVLATGTRGKPRTLGVPGENLPKVSNILEDPDVFRSKHVLIVGGGDSAIEAALALADAGAKVTLSYRGGAFNRAQAKNKSLLAKAEDARRLDIALKSQVLGLAQDTVTLKLGDGAEQTIPNHATFVLIGADPPIAWLEKLGVHYVERPHWYALGATDQLVESIVGKQADTPTNAADAVRLVLGNALPAGKSRSAVPEASVVRRMPVPPMERPATVPGVFIQVDGDGRIVTSAMLPANADRIAEDLPKMRAQSAGVSLDEFVQSQRGARAGTSRPKGAEVTRILRALRDDGAKLAYEESGVDLLGEDTGVRLLSQITSLSSLERKAEPATVAIGGPRPRAAAPPPPPPSKRPPPPPVTLADARIDDVRRPSTRAETFEPTMARTTPRIPPTERLASDTGVDLDDDFDGFLPEEMRRSSTAIQTTIEPIDRGDAPLYLPDDVEGVRHAATRSPAASRLEPRAPSPTRIEPPPVAQSPRPPSAARLDPQRSSPPTPHREPLRTPSGGRPEPQRTTSATRLDPRLSRPSSPPTPLAVPRPERSSRPQPAQRFLPSDTVQDPLDESTTHSQPPPERTQQSVARHVVRRTPSESPLAAVTDDVTARHGATEELMGAAPARHVAAEEFKGATPARHVVRRDRPAPSRPTGEIAAASDPRNERTVSDPRTARDSTSRDFDPDDPFAHESTRVADPDALRRLRETDDE